MKTIYQKAKEAIDREISVYIELLESTNGLSSINSAALAEENVQTLFGAGLGIAPEQAVTLGPDYLVAEFNRKSALKYDVESAVCVGVYNTIRDHGHHLFSLAEKKTKSFTSFSPSLFGESPYLLPIFQNILGLSKSQLVKIVGSVSDTGLSRPATKRISDLLTEKCESGSLFVDKSNVLQRLEVTLEGIVRDLVGRVLFEEVVSHALTKENVVHLREDEYPSLSGVVYNFRSDFVIPDHRDPIAFIEVRKSSSRHASLYAKDKMFSAINWKGKHKGVIGIIVVEGDWTQATLKILATVFDYVVPLSKATNLAKMLKKAQDGDESFQKWLIDFSISASPHFGGHVI